MAKTKDKIKSKSEFSNNILIKDNPENPFQHDYSGKLEQFAKNLTNFIENKTQGKPLVISLSAP